MSYTQHIQLETHGSLKALLQQSLQENPQIGGLIDKAITAESAAIAPQNIDSTSRESYPLTKESQELINALKKSADHNLVLVVEKILKSLKFAVITAQWQGIP